MTPRDERSAGNPFEETPEPPPIPQTTGMANSTTDELIARSLQPGRRALGPTGNQSSGPASKRIEWVRTSTLINRGTRQSAGSVLAAKGRLLAMISRGGPEVRDQVTEQLKRLREARAERLGPPEPLDVAAVTGIERDSAECR